jgi:hypothetical protein
VSATVDAGMARVLQIFFCGHEVLAPIGRGRQALRKGGGPSANDAARPDAGARRGDSRMHRPKHEPLMACTDCRKPFSPAQERGFELDDGGGLCFDCTVIRGGVYDGLYERWVTPPRLDGLTLHLKRGP